jgi:hypothetical protein
MEIKIAGKRPPTKQKLKQDRNIANAGGERWTELAPPFV